MGGEIIGDTGSDSEVGGEWKIVTDVTRGIDSDVPEGGNAEHKEKLESYKQYVVESRRGGIEMPTRESFDRKVRIAVDVFPQIVDGKVRYLFGKGIGVELALSGNVVGREKRRDAFPYRSHSDFEIYDYDGDYTENREAREFAEIFGAQEYYGKAGTKALKEMPEGYMDETCEKVVYDGKEYLVPELEILFLDKYLRQESTPREEGCDAVLLAKAYKLDSGKIMSYYEKFVAKPELEKMKIEELETRKYVIHALQSWLGLAESECDEDDLMKTRELLEKKLNDRIQRCKKKGVLAIADYLPDGVRVVENEDGSFALDEGCYSEIDKLVAMGYEGKRGLMVKEAAKIKALLEELELG